jgi:membrane-associated protease RseP (regulator of RpoE activity)
MNKQFQTVLGALLALGMLPAAFGADEPKAKDEAELEAKLAAARERLEAAAREVAELSGELTGPIMQDFFVMRREPHAIIGVGIDVERESKDGVPVQSVTPGGPAGDAGIKAGDVITSIDGKSLRRDTSAEAARALVEHMREVKPGDKVKVEYQREGKSHKTELVAEKPNFKGFRVAGPMQDHMFNVPVPPPAPGAMVAPLPRFAEGPFTMAFRGFGRQGLLDMELITLTPKLGQYFGTDKGVLVVRPPSKSELKLEEGDVIVDIDGRAPQNGAHALRILGSYQQGEKVSVNVLRNRKPVKLQFTLPKGDDMEESGAAYWLESPDIEIEKRVVPAPRPAPSPSSEETM